MSVALTHECPTVRASAWVDTAVESNGTRSLHLGPFKNILSVGKCQELFFPDVVLSTAVHPKLTMDKGVS